MNPVRPLLEAGPWLRLTLSRPPKGAPISRVSARPVELKGRPQVQLEYVEGKQARHRNLETGPALDEIDRLLALGFRQAHLATPGESIQVLLPSGKITREAAARGPAGAGHDRVKAHAFPEGEPVPHLVELGVMSPDGRVKAEQRDKFRQVNRFAELASAAIDELPAKRPLKVVDYGCGKGYLTFTLARLLADRGLEAEVLGLDLKEDVVHRIAGAAARLGFRNLSFRVGDIATDAGKADLVVMLHACDTATDEGLAKAVRAGATVILAAPCCQHELRDRLDPAALAPLLKHGLLRERISALATDALRAALLEAEGYRVQVLEFVDPEHTPKNLLLRAVRTPGLDRKAAREAYLALRGFWGAGPRLERLLAKP